MTRREFAAFVAALPLLRRASLEVRIALVGPADNDAARGAQMSVDEAKRAALLLSGSVQLVSNTADASGIVLTVGSDLSKLPSNVAIIDATSTPPTNAPNLFHVQPANAADCVVWSPQLEKFGAAQLNDRYRAAFHADMTPQAWGGWFAVKVLWESALRARSDKAQDILAYIKSDRASYDGHKGDLLHFNPKTGYLETQWRSNAQPSSYPCSH